MICMVLELLLSGYQSPSLDSMLDSTSAEPKAFNMLCHRAQCPSAPGSHFVMQVGRRSDPLQDAAVVLAVRQAVGPGVVLRADANRAWSLKQAVEVGYELG